MTQQKRRKADDQSFLARNAATLIVIAAAVISVTGVQGKSAAFGERLDSYETRQDIIDQRSIENALIADKALDTAQKAVALERENKRELAEQRREIEDLKEIRPKLQEAFDRALKEIIERATGGP